MSRGRRSAALLVTLLVTFVATGEALSVRDMEGRELLLPALPQRIVSLVPSVTEMIYALGGEDRLAGRTDFCDYPPAARAKTSVGGMISPSLETLVTLKPDLVIATSSGNREETFRQLTRLGIPVYLMGADRIADVKDVARRLGALGWWPTALKEPVTTTRRTEASRAAARRLRVPRTLQS